MGPESPAAALAGPLAAGLLLSFAIEALSTPRPAAPWRRPAAALLLHFGLWLSVFAALFALLARPWFASAAANAGLLLIVVVGQAKYRSLREPFVFQDFEYFSDALRHPRLYLPFLGWGKAALAAGGFLLAVYVGLRLERSLYQQFAPAHLLAVMAGLATAAAAATAAGSRNCPPPGPDAESDLIASGLLASLWACGCAERSLPALPSPYRELVPLPRSGPLPNLVVVQSESFFDPREHFPGIRREVLAGWDALCADSAASGPLTVPAWGANTVRSEFAFLSGLGEACLGVHRFNPYRKLPAGGIATLAGFLRRLGYLTVCVHPYPAAFYRRDRVYPGFGFERFIDIREFAGAERCGPYVADAALAAKVNELLGQGAGRPLFIFAISMENHGPLHLESVSPAEAMLYHDAPPPPGCADLSVYLRHLANADRMAKTIAAGLAASPADGWLCWYGDHVPIMPEVYRRLGSPPGTTGYLLWRKGGSGGGERRPRRVEELGTLLLRAAGIAAPAPAPRPAAVQ